MPSGFYESQSPLSNRVFIYTEKWPNKFIVPRQSQSPLSNRVFIYGWYRRTLAHSIKKSQSPLSNRVFIYTESTALIISQIADMSQSPLSNRVFIYGDLERERECSETPCLNPLYPIGSSSTVPCETLVWRASAGLFTRRSDFSASS